MQLIENWRKLALRLWSIRLALLAAGLSAVEFALPFIPFDVPPRWFAGLAFAVSIAAAVARLVAQPKTKAEVEA